MGRARLSFFLIPALAWGMGCAEEPPLAIEEDAPRSLQPASCKDGDLYGSLWINGQSYSGGGGYYIEVIPDLSRDPAYWARFDRVVASFGEAQPLRMADVSGTQNLTPSCEQDWGYLAPYNSGALRSQACRTRDPSRAREAHGDTTEFEKHCIVPGAFEVTLFSENGEVPGASRRIDFIAPAPPGNVNAPVLVEDTTSALEAGLPDPIIYMDHAVQFDIQGAPSTVSGSFTIAPQNGTKGTTWFQFTPTAVTTSWNLHCDGAVSVRYEWDPTDDFGRTGYMNTHNADKCDQLVARRRRFGPSAPDTVRITAYFITPDGGQASANGKRIILSPAPTSSLCVTNTVSPTATTVGSPVSFQWCPTGDRTGQEHRWLFGDGSTTAWSASNAAVQHAYAATGTYTATLEVRQPSTGQTAQRTITITVGSTPQLCMSHSVSPTTTTVGSPVSFQWCPVGDRTGQEHRWLFGDGSTTAWSASNVAVQHSYAAQGTFVATLEVRRQANPSDMDETQVQITVNPGVILCMERWVNPTSTAIGSPVSFTWCFSGDRTNQQRRWIFGDGTSTSWGTSVTITHAYGAAGTYTATLEVRSTVDPAVVDQRQVQITVDQPVDNAQAMGNSFETAMAQGQYYAVSVSMKNTGSTTWSNAAGYSLVQSSPGDEFMPLSVGFGSGTTTPGATKTFSFNLYNYAPYGASYDVFYRMHHDTPFGEPNGRTIESLHPDTCVKFCTFSFIGPEESRLFPGGATDEWTSAAEAVPLQSLVAEGHPLRFEREDGRHVARIRYFGALAEPWPVDVEFRISVDPGTVRPGEVRLGRIVSGYDVEVDVEPSAIVVKMRRRSAAAALPARQGLLLEIPLVATSPDHALPIVPRVELTVTR